MSAISRSKLISFRLTAEEYEKCVALCASNEMRSISELARTGIKLILAHTADVSPETLQFRVSEIEVRLSTLLGEVRRLSARAASEESPAGGHRIEGGK